MSEQVSERKNIQDEMQMERAAWHSTTAGGLGLSTARAKLLSDQL